VYQELQGAGFVDRPDTLAADSHGVLTGGC
jgi:hypothetical protein